MAVLEGFLPEQDQPLQTGFFNAAHKSLGVGVQTATPRWQLHGFHARFLQYPEEFVCEQRIPIMDQVALTRSSPSAESVRLREIWLIHSPLAAVDIPPIAPASNDNSIKDSTTNRRSPLAARLSGQ